MKILKIINNNVISAIDDNGYEVVVMGRGVGFGVTAGQKVDSDKVRKVFMLGSRDTANKFAELLSDMPVEHVRIASDVIDYIKETSPKKLNKNIYITLTDHIDFAIERFKAGMGLHNPLLFDVKTFYPTEYKIGKKALTIIKKRTGINLPDDEAASIALHIVNAEYGTEIGQIMNLTEMIGEIIDIIERYFCITIKDESLDFDRFVTHLKFFLLRMQKAESLSDDDEFNTMIRKSCANEYECARQIVSHVTAKFKGEINEAELTYLTVHIRRLLEHNKEK